MSIRLWAAGAGLVAAVAAGVAASADQSSLDRDVGDFSIFSWRHLGPFDGGDTAVVEGVASDPRVLFLGAAGGGIWKTTDYGLTWRPVFDRASTGVIGSIAVAPSDPRVVYAGTGTAVDADTMPNGDGLYKSTDAGATWHVIGLAETARIPAVAVHPTNPEILLVAALGDAHRPGEDRGVYRSANGGRTFERVLFRDTRTGGFDVRFDARQPAMAYATLAPSAAAAARGPDDSAGGVYRSTDGGLTWQPAGTGLPSAAGQGLERAKLATSPGRSGQLFASVDARAGAGVYRSNDAGASWTLAGSDERVNGSAIAVDPVQPDVLYAAGRGALRSTDGGRTWAVWRPAPGPAGRYHHVWIHPANPAVAALASSHGAVVTVNAGATWSSVASQATAAFAQVTTDAAFPYRVCGGQPTGEVLCLAGGRSLLSPAEAPAPYPGRPGYVIADPADAELLFTGELRRYERRSGQTVDITPPGQPRSSARAMSPLLFAPGNARALYYAAAALWVSTSAGQSWTKISPDMGGAADAGASPAGISAVSVSGVDGRVIWIGTDHGRVHLTRDQGATWTDVTPPEPDAGETVAALQASYFDTNTGYAVLTGRDGRGSRVLRTRTAGGSWTDITTGITPGRISVIREDVARRGLLFAGGDRSIFVSFDDGALWHPLTLNLPPAPVRDLVVRDSDVIVATAGRGFWALDDISPLRQVTADVRRARAFLFRPAPAWRTRDGLGDADTHVERPAPRPEGVAISYALGAALTEPLVVEIVDGPAGMLVRRFSTENAGEPLPRATGLHRFQWDLRHTPPAVDWLNGDASERPRGRWVLPGTYQVRLIAGQVNLRQALLVRMDPRVRASAADLAEQSRVTAAIEEHLARLASGYRSVGAGRPSLLPDSPMGGASSHVADAFRDAGRELVRVFERVQQSDSRPTPATETAVSAALARAVAVLDQAR